MENVPKLAVRVALVLMLSSLAAHASTNLIINPGFSQFNLDGSSVGWTFNDPDGDGSNLPYNGNFMGATSHGSDGWFFWGGEITPEGINHHPAYVEQVDIPTVAGQQYTLNFWMRDLSGVPDDPTNTDTYPVNNSLEVYWNNVTPGSDVASWAQVQPTANYQQYTVYLTATSSSSTVRFEAFNPPTALLLDDISLTEGTPEPNTIFLFGGAGLAMLLFGRRLRRA